MRKLLVIAAVTAVAIVGAEKLGGSSAPLAAPAPNAEAQALEIARAEAAQGGEPNPSGISVRHGTLREIMKQLNPENEVPASPEGLAEVTVVLMHGHFTLTDAHVPPGHPAPQGDVYAVIVNPSGTVVGRALPAETSELASAASATDATIIGRLLVGGGPPSQPRVRPGDRVQVLVMQGKRVVKQVRTNRRGSFALNIKPGSYQLKGKVGPLCPARKVTVHRGDRRYVELNCALR